MIAERRTSFYRVKWANATIGTKACKTVDEAVDSRRANPLLILA
jgi:hypothetical protein